MPTCHGPPRRGKVAFTRGGCPSTARLTRQGHRRPNASSLRSPLRRQGVEADAYGREPSRQRASSTSSRAAKPGRARWCRCLAGQRHRRAPAAGPERGRRLFSVPSWAAEHPCGERSEPAAAPSASADRAAAQPAASAGSRTRPRCPGGRSRPKARPSRPPLHRRSHARTDVRILSDTGWRCQSLTPRMAQFSHTAANSQRSGARDSGGIPARDHGGIPPRGAFHRGGASHRGGDPTAGLIPRRGCPTAGAIPWCRRRGPLWGRRPS